MFLQMVALGILVILFFIYGVPFIISAVEYYQNWRSRRKYLIIIKKMVLIPNKKEIKRINKILEKVVFHGNAKDCNCCRFSYDCRMDMKECLIEQEWYFLKKKIVENLQIKQEQQISLDDLKKILEFY